MAVRCLLLAFTSQLVLVQVLPLCHYLNAKIFQFGWSQVLFSQEAVEQLSTSLPFLHVKKKLLLIFATHTFFQFWLKFQLKWDAALQPSLHYEKKTFPIIYSQRTLFSIMDEVWEFFPLLTSWNETVFYSFSRTMKKRPSPKFILWVVGQVIA